MERETAVIFAGLIGAAELYARGGEAAAPEAIGRALERLAQAAASCGARAIKRIGGRLMVVAPSADAAARAAAAMQLAAGDLPAPASSLALGIGFHLGPVIQEGGEVFGSTVNVAARLVERASRGQILIAAETATALSPPYREAMRHLYSTPVKGLSEEVELCELVWRANEPGASVPIHAAAEPPRTKLRLEHGGRQFLLRRSHEALTIGRGARCDLVVTDQYASRQHCHIERRADDFVLVDHSTNGTFVTVEGEGELLVEREAFTLREHGWISLGVPRGKGAAVEFFCE